ICSVSYQSLNSSTGTFEKSIAAIRIPLAIASPPLPAMPHFYGRRARCARFKGRQDDPAPEASMPQCSAAITTLVAAERTGRNCRGLELDPAYVDTAIRRWQALTGARARHAGGGRLFEEN